ncbi:hypothetical protein BG846_00661 [Streptomyces fradiae ATCC 10745 = DSM 40063]|uniref:Uncharacterized protein n=1 Tax=Streptomyces fradiae ATCC 10745 = DSM 40063 TaxID=1319510 RepID=A0A1Y2P1G1_STRFR|nr:hypothetical protein BG846_00661 [Streptomyces fradiae ATCC 10745 = DSM 40063]
MVGQHPRRRGAHRPGGPQRLVDHPAQRRRVPGAPQVVEVERLVQLVAAHVQGEPLRRRGPRLGDPDALRAAARPRRPLRPRSVRVEEAAPLAVDLVDAVLVEEGQLLRADQPGLLAVADVGQAGRLDHPVRHVEPEPVDAQIQPEPQHGREVGPHLLVLPVQVGLLGREEVQVPGAVRDPRPGGAAEDGLPVVGRQRAVRAPAGTEVVPVAPGARQGGLEPRVPVRGVVGHHVQDHAQAQLVGGPHERVGVGQVPEDGVDGPVVRHVVAAVRLRGGVERGQPHRVGPQPGHVRQPFARAPQVAYAVAVRVGERADVHLVDDRVPPPSGAVGRSGARAPRCRGRGGQLVGHGRCGLPSGTRPSASGVKRLAERAAVPQGRLGGRAEASVERLCLVCQAMRRQP